MGSISTATWLSLATGWLVTAAAVAVVATAPDDQPATLSPPQTPARVLLQEEAGDVEAALLSPHYSLVTFSTRIAP
jgi:hypothetical protein